MLRFALTRIAMALPTLLIVAVSVFVLIRLIPGDPASLMLGARTEALGTDLVIDPDEIEQARWVSREELVSAFAGRHPEIKPARPGAIAHFILRNWLADRLD